MGLLEIRKPDFSFEDDRGALFQLVHSGYEQINVLVTKAGVSRGGHYHKKSIECFFVVSGCVEVFAKKNNESQKSLFKKNDFFQINSNVVHSMFFPEDCVMVAMYDKCVEQIDGSKDIFPE